MSRVVDWLLGRKKLKEKIVDLERIVTEREKQIVKAAEVVRQVRQEVENCNLKIQTLTFENNLLKKTSEILNKNS